MCVGFVQGIGHYNDSKWGKHYKKKTLPCDFSDAHLVSMRFE
jgi:hypothetical protein